MRLTEPKSETGIWFIAVIYINNVIYARSFVARMERKRNPGRGASPGFHPGYSTSSMRTDVIYARRS